MTLFKKITVTTLSLAMSIGALSSVYAAESSGEITFSDLNKASVWAREAIVKAKEYNLMAGSSDGTFRPMSAVTRQEVAAALNNVMQIEPLQLSKSSFTDVISGSWSAGAIEVMKSSGWMLGDGNGTFRPTAPLTREEMAVLLVKIANINIESSVPELSVTDKDKISSWAKQSVALALESGLMQGTGTSFNPLQPVLRQEMAAIVLRVAEMKNNQQTSIIEQINNDTITISGKNYALSESLKKLFKNNSEALAKAKVKFKDENNTIISITYLELAQSGKPADTGKPEFSGNIVFDGNGANIEGSLKVAADYVTLKNINIQGNLNIGSELYNDFYALNVNVKGNTLVNGGDENTVVFDKAQLSAMTINKKNVHVEAKNMTTIGDVTVHSELSSLWGDSSVVYGHVKLQDTVRSFWNYANIKELQITASKEETILSGNGRIDKLEISGEGKAKIMTTVPIGTIIIKNKDAQITLPLNVNIANLVLPEGVKAQDIISNYEQVKTHIGQLNNNVNPEYINKIGSGSNNSSGSGSSSGNNGNSGSGGNTTTPSPTEPPLQPGNSNNFLIKTYKYRDMNSVELVLKPKASGTVYFIATPSTYNSSRPTIEQIKNGKNDDNSPADSSGHFSVTAGSLATHKAVGLKEEEAYIIWSVFVDAAGKESGVTFLYSVQNYQPNSNIVLPYEKANLSEISTQFTSPLDNNVTMVTDPKAILQKGILRNYGFGYIPVKSISWDVSKPDMPILTFHFDQVNLGTIDSYRIDWRFVDRALTMDGGKYGLGGHGAYTGEKVVDLITAQLKLETGTVADPVKADDVIYVLKAYPSPLDTELNLIEYNAEYYQRYFAEVNGSIHNYTDVKSIIANVNTQYPAPAKEVTEVLMNMNNASSSNTIKYYLENKASIIGIDLTSYTAMNTDAKNLISQYVLTQRKLQPRGKYTNLEQIRIAFEEACSLNTDIPLGLSFIDTDARAGYLGGIIIWTPGSDEAGIEQYELLYSFNKQSSTVLATVDKVSGHQYVLPVDTIVPAGATHIGVRGIRAEQSYTAVVYTPLKDILPLQPGKPAVDNDDMYNVLVGADNTMEFSIDSGVSWITYDEQSDYTFPGRISVYVRYKADSQNQVPAGKYEIVSFVDNVYMFVGINDVGNTFDQGATSAMEYSSDNGHTWTTYVNQEFPGDLKILLRERGSSVLPAGATKAFEFTSKVNIGIFSGGKYFEPSCDSFEYSLNGSEYQHWPKDKIIQFNPGDIVVIREEARGQFPAGKEEVFNIQ
ncbi:DUF4073 domain-containing protein [Paenibacillus glacialis]|uniref:SLH domain-containing protein n=1 Tax=Paenibacillus glacialis TaxID=494026 RepID=A0A168KN79_9BACL|nr:DUF4073 domain-containing protein [Paenibacillus glacialis]OAB42250.1 hypothetical protein PGLA_13160 [Paenibacillus glacialis]